MKVVREVRLQDFEFWSGAKHIASLFTYDELDRIEEILEEIYPDGINETSVNDLFWFDLYILLDWLEIEQDEETFIQARCER